MWLPGAAEAALAILCTSFALNLDRAADHQPSTLPLFLSTCLFSQVSNFSVPKDGNPAGPATQLASYTEK